MPVRSRCNYRVTPSHRTMYGTTFSIFIGQSLMTNSVFSPIRMAITLCPSSRWGQSLNQSVIRQAYRFILETNRAKQIARIENVPSSLIPFFSRMGFHAVQKETEYLYKTEALIQLKGDRYKSKTGYLQRSGSQPSRRAVASLPTCPSGGLPCTL